ncbi:hypothetical protein VYU27_010791, partial [Nannochloropsis oceanica]
MPMEGEGEVEGEEEEQGREEKEEVHLLLYPGPLLEAPLSDWILSHDVPLFGRLGGPSLPPSFPPSSLLSEEEGGLLRGGLGGGEAYVQKFFNSALVKYVAFVRRDQANARQ